ncbi:MAG TPA: alpha-L-fucosidase [Treponema sp.]|nr:alpha-L-fucosidase [Treponema sp.]
MNTVWYKTPAEDWNSALPLGNGRIGAMVYGGFGHETIQLNEESVWSGEHKDRNNRSCAQTIHDIQDKLAKGQTGEAERLAFEAMSGTPSQQTVYQTAGNLLIDFFTAEGQEIGGGDVSVYKRELDLETAAATVSFSMESSMPSTAFFSKNTQGSSISYTREVIASAPADVLAVHIAATTPKSIFFRAYLERGNFSTRQYSLSDDTIVLEDTHGIPFCVMATAVLSGGKCMTRGGCIVVEGADEVTLYVDIESAFRKRNYYRKGGHVHNSPARLAAWCVDRALRRLCFASSQPYGDFRAAHIKEYGRWYKAVSLSLAKDEALEKLPADELLSGHAGSTALAELYWNYNRYLLISCSRAPGTLPATLQGLWNKDMDPPWGSKFTININTEMNYWPASMCGLGDTELPLFRLLERAHRNGKKTARIMYGCGGFVAHHNLDIWADTAPQDTWIPGTYWLLGAAWLATHVREHYEYTLDKKFLRKYFYLLRDACRFFAEFLIPSEDGKHLILSPSVSPENTYRLADGSRASLCAGADMDNRILEHLFRATLQSAKDLALPDTDSDMLHVRAMLAKLEPPAITAEGTIREWPFACEETEPGHRHISHLYGLFPGHSISAVRTPDLAQAARKTIEKRLANGGGHTGWSLAWILNFRASLHDGVSAGKELETLFTKSTQPNLLDSHPPFQIDGNFGSLAAMTRMIAQSEQDGSRIVIDVLPALPPSWTEGSLRGLHLKGNIKLDISWSEGGIRAAELYTAPGTTYCKNIAICYQNRLYEANLSDGRLDIMNVLPSTV